MSCQVASDRRCWIPCQSCFRCADKGKYDKCNNCTGHHDVKYLRDPYDVDDYCRCKEGIFQYRTSKGHLIIRKFPKNPFRGSWKSDAASTGDESDWDSYLQQLREELDNASYDPVQFSDGGSTYDWIQRARKGGRL